MLASQPASQSSEARHLAGERNPSHPYQPHPRPLPRPSYLHLTPTPNSQIRLSPSSIPPPPLPPLRLPPLLLQPPPHRVPHPLDHHIGHHRRRLRPIVDAAPHQDGPPLRAAGAAVVVRALDVARGVVCGEGISSATAHRTMHDTAPHRTPARPSSAQRRFSAREKERREREGKAHTPNHIHPPQPPPALPHSLPSHPHPRPPLLQPPLRKPKRDPMRFPIHPTPQLRPPGHLIPHAPERGLKGPLPQARQRPRSRPQQVRV